MWRHRPEPYVRPIRFSSAPRSFDTPTRPMPTAPTTEREADDGERADHPGRGGTVLFEKAWLRHSPGVGLPVSRRGPRRQENPRPAGAGSANPGFYAESRGLPTLCMSVRPRSTAKRGPSLYRAFSDGCEHPPDTPASVPGPRRTGVGVSSHLFACGEAGKTRLGRVASRRRV
jgi:hypothetical protein